MRGKLKWLIAIALAAVGLAASAFVAPWTFECKLFTACHKLNIGYALVSLFSQQIQDSISKEEIYLRIAHSISFTILGAVLGLLIGCALDMRFRPRGQVVTSDATVLHKDSADSAAAAPRHAKAVELELTGQEGFRGNYLRIAQPELARLARGLLVGRDAAEADFHIEDETISRRHARLSATSDEFLVEDLNSTNGTRLNGRSLRPHEPTALQAGDRLSIGSANFHVVVTRS